MNDNALHQRLLGLDANVLYLHLSRLAAHSGNLLTNRNAALVIS